ncbi:MAG: dehydratase [Rhodospirillaceae bacterium]|nr:dehydratase [Rhodospirillaceae bacterium]
MSMPPIAVGETRRFSKTLTETDVSVFAGLTGDLARVHVDEAAMRSSRFGGRIVHGALLIGLIGTTVTMLVETPAFKVEGAVPVVLGYRDIRFFAPVRLDDTIAATLTITRLDPAKARAMAEVVLVNQAGTTVMTGSVTIQWVADGSSSP